MSKKDRELLYKAMHDVITDVRLSLLQKDKPYNENSIDVTLAQLELKIWDRQKPLFKE